MKITIINPSGPQRFKGLSSHLKVLEPFGTVTTHFAPPLDKSDWPYTAAPASVRARLLEESLLGDSDILMAVRGGYGCQELLPLLDWSKLRASRRKLLVGFSDISALSAAFWSQLGWPSLHGPMPGTAQWADCYGVYSGILAAFSKAACQNVVVPVRHHTGSQEALSGPLFGGCFSVLSQLIGTKWFPSLSSSILYLEDIGEHPARLMRYWEQWRQSGVLDGVLAIVVGDLVGCGREEEDGIGREEVLQEWSRRVEVPFYSSMAFGHGKENTLLGFGYKGQISPSGLCWEFNGDLSDG